MSKFIPNFTADYITILIININKSTFESYEKNKNSFIYCGSSDVHSCICTVDQTKGSCKHSACYGHKAIPV